MKEFGFLKGMPHDNCGEDFRDYEKLKNTISKTKVIQYIESDRVVKCYGLMSSHDMFTGEPIVCGLIEDGNFIFPMEFFYYYKNYDIGIPYDYEEYLKGIIDY